VKVGQGGVVAVVAEGRLAVPLDEDEYLTGAMLPVMLPGTGRRKIVLAFLRVQSLKIMRSGSVGGCPWGSQHVGDLPGQRSDPRTFRSGHGQTHLTQAAASIKTAATRFVSGTTWSNWPLAKAPWSPR
jgi:hypothetical protein